MKIGMPESLSVVEHAKNLKEQGRLPQNPSTVDLRARVVAEKLNIAGPGNAASGMTQGSDFDGSYMVLPVMSVACYDRNPRTSVNPKFQEIKTSIQERRKLPGSLAVTRRPGSQQYMLYMGGNTRLLAVQELWQETADPAFQQINVVYCEWISEADVLSAHLIENEARADTSFWEKATGVVALKTELEKETGSSLSSRALEVHLQKLGMSVGSTLIQNYLFATETLASIGSFLRRDDMKLLKPRINAHKHVAQQFHLALDLYPRLLESTLERYAANLNQDTPFDAAALCSLLDEQFAKSINVSANELRLMMRALVIDPNLTSESLRQAGKDSSEESSSQAPRHNQRQSAIHQQSNKANTAQDVSSTDLRSSSAFPEKRSSSVQTLSPEQMAQHLRELITRLCEVAYVTDCLHFQNELPLGFYLELPEELIDSSEVPDIHLRRSGWQLLAMLSGQFDQRIAKRLPIESRWLQVMQLDTLSEKSFESEFTFLVQGICSEAGAPGASIEDISYFLWHPTAGPLFRELLRLAHAWRSLEPGRFQGHGMNSHFAS